ncbi:hypothetical protein BDV95DRAFT_502384, partial [Massariosphaeria phaeospora]
YDIRAIPGKGYGCFAIKPIAAGTRIIAESPLLVVPVAEYYQEDIQAAFDKLSAADKELYFTLHSAHGQDPKHWPSQIHSTVTPREQKRILEQHNARVGKEPSLISIFQTNCMEMEDGAAIFPNASRLNHSCNPNACFVWNAAIYKETIHVMRKVEKGEEITVSYCDQMHEKTLRAWELKHYGFSCDCPACAGDETDSSSFACMSAERRYRMDELHREVRPYRGKHLEQGAKKERFVENLLNLAVLHMEDGDHSARLANIFLDIALVSEVNGDLKTAFSAATKACAVKRNCQGTDFPEYKKYEAVYQRIATKKRGQQ